jgi:phenylacetate-CoA ligase
VADFVFYWRWWNWFGYRLGQPYAQLNTDFFLKSKGKLETPFEWHPSYRRLLINPLQLTRRSVPGILGAIKQHRVRYLIGASSMVFNLALSSVRWSRSTPTLSAIFTGGDQLSSGYRKTIEDFFQARVADFYGHMENTVKIAQCPRGRYHVCSDFGILETRSLEGRHSPGVHRARVIATGFHQRAMPLLRYDTGDDILIEADPPDCTCGRTFPLVSGIVGRSDDFIVVPDGRRITLYLNEFAPTAIALQTIQKERRMVEVLVVPDSNWSPTEATRLHHGAERILGSEMKIRIKLVRHEDLRRGQSGKIQAVICDLDEARLSS